MTENYDALLSSPDYAFLASNPNLGSNVDSLFLGGSKAYGLSTPDSDTDIRGFATRSAEDILLGRDFGTVVEKTTDTTIYSFDKFVHLLAGANPNIVEFLGLHGDAYIRVGAAGRLLLDNADAFLSNQPMIQQINTLSREQVAAERAQAEREGRNYFVFRHALADRGSRAR